MLILTATKTILYEILFTQKERTPRAWRSKRQVCQTISRRNQTMNIAGEAIIQGPFAHIDSGLLFDQFGQLIKFLKDDRSYGRNAVLNGKSETFHVVLYEDDSWRIATPQLDLFPDEKVVKKTPAEYVEDVRSWYKAT